MTTTTHGNDAHATGHAHKKHTNPVLVFGILTIITVIEIVVTLFGLPREVLVPLLIAMSFAKASLVAAYYMHLRYENWIYTAVFITPSLFAIFLMLVLAA
jgi:cytochrome c oxidase subunit 4